MISDPSTHLPERRHQGASGSDSSRIAIASGLFEPAVPATAPTASRMNLQLPFQADPNRARSVVLAGVAAGLALFCAACGENKENKGHFFRLEAWGKTAEAISKYFSKGDTIIVKGELYWSSWQDKESGAKREGVRIRVSEFYFGGDSPKRSEEQGDVTAPPVRPAAKEVFYKTPEKLGPRPNLPAALPGDDDIPY